ncbi:MAG: TetR/AcrR family transcriptional regulator [Rhodoplanes sp.]
MEQKRTSIRPNNAGQKASASEVRLGPEDWINAAIIMLADDNVDALTIDALAKQLGVTKGSFYWHFASRESLLTAVVQTWRERTTSQIQHYIENIVGSPSARLERLLDLAITPRRDVPGGPLELTLRDWGRRNPAVQREIEEVDAERIAWLVHFYTEAGQSEKEANELAFAHLALTVGTRMVLSKGRSEDFDRRRPIVKTLLLPKPRGRRHKSRTTKVYGSRLARST